MFNVIFLSENQADPAVVEFWGKLALELNGLGCSRTAKEWQHVSNTTSCIKLMRPEHGAGVLLTCFILKIICFSHRFGIHGW